ncbi:hypothetical protein BD311DRAFT_749844 [Dichomitus squalens]|uniref:Uncharacterized protein n=1 Tax=Dichomitus squalens TaxID=114155 RepID=A0A4Q9MXR7_9APHY|nr:hypothetical protein BD311DRAFT_749844 [Dichomitus squalens]
MAHVALTATQHRAILPVACFAAPCQRYVSVSAITCRADVSPTYTTPTTGHASLNLPSPSTDPFLMPFESSSDQMTGRCGLLGTPFRENVQALQPSIVTSELENAPWPSLRTPLP